MYYTVLRGCLYPLLLAGGSDGLSCIKFLDNSGVAEAVPAGWCKNSAFFTEAVRELEEYFSGKRKKFGLKLMPEGTAFQREVWDALCRIPYGQTRSYGEIAGSIGRPGACRAVGTACGKNPLPVVIPCHRVIGADGGLTGFSSGLGIKRALLKLEGVALWD